MQEFLINIFYVLHFYEVTQYLFPSDTYPSRHSTLQVQRGGPFPHQSHHQSPFDYSR
jgi:hypothetical protein